MRMRSLASITDSVDTHLRKLRERVKDRGAWCAVVHGFVRRRTRLSDWLTTLVACQWRIQTSTSCRHSALQQGLLTLTPTVGWAVN